MTWPWLKLGKLASKVLSILSQVTCDFGVWGPPLFKDIHVYKCYEERLKERGKKIKSKMMGVVHECPLSQGKKVRVPIMAPILLIGSIFYAFVLSINWAQPHLNWKDGIYIHKYRFIITKIDNLCDTHTHFHPSHLYIKPLIPLTKRNFPLLFFFLFFFFFNWVLKKKHKSMGLGT